MVADAVSRFHEILKWTHVAPFVYLISMHGHLSQRSLSFLLNRSHNWTEAYRLPGR